MNKSIRFLFLSFVFGFLVPAACLRAGSISGKITDKESGKPLISASVALHRAGDSTLVTGAITKNDGTFHMNSIGNGNYYLKITYIGYKDRMKQGIVVNASKPDVNLGDIYLIADYVSTSEVSVTAEKEQIAYNFDKKVINVDRSIVAAGGSAVDVLRNTPSVAVDVDGNVSLRGNSNLQIQIDGKSTSLTQLGSAALDMIPAGSIDRIEIITNPSARYEAEGSTGIINIVMKKEKADGVNGVFTVNAGSGDKYGASANVNWLVGDFNIFTNYSYRTNRRSGYGNSTKTIWAGDTTTTLVQDGDRWHNMTSHRINPGIEFSFLDKNRLSFSFSYNYAEREFNSLSRYNQNNNIVQLPLLYNNSNTEPTYDNAYDINLSYNRTFEKKGHELNANAMYSYSNDNEHTDSYLQYLDADPEYLSKKWTTDTDERYKTTTLQVDYIEPFASGIKIEAGYKTTIRDFDNDFYYYNTDISSGIESEDIAKKNKFLFTENVHALYAIFQDSIASFRYQGGLRYEYTAISGNQKVTGETFDRNYGNLFPSVHLSYELTDLHKAFVSYSRRISRPRNHDLDPIVDYSDSLNLRFGNPNLKPEYIDAVEFGLENNFDFISLTSTLFYRKTTDMIAHYQYKISDNVFGNTQLNIASGVNYGLEFTASKKIAPWWRLNGDFSFFNNEITGTVPDMEVDNESFNWTARINSNMFFGDYSFQIIGEYRSPSATAQGKRFEMFNIDLGAKMDLFDRKLQVFARLSDVFNTRKFKFENNGNGYSSINEMHFESRVFILGLTYKLNANGFMKDKKRMQQQEDNGYEDME